MRQQQGHERVPEPGTRRTAAAAATAAPAPAAATAFAAGSLSVASPASDANAIAYPLTLASPYRTNSRCPGVRKPVG